MRVQISLWNTDFIYFVYILRSGISESYSNFIFNFLRNFMVFQFSMVSVRIYITTNSVQEFPFLYNLLNTSLCFFLFSFGIEHSSPRVSIFLYILL